MNEVLNLPLEPERYELREGPRYHFRFPRRTFFKVLGSGVLIVCVARQAMAQESGRGGGRRGGGRGRPQEISAWLHIGADGTVTAFTGKAEVGQNVRTMLTQVVAEELRMPVASIRFVVGDTELTPYDAGTFGSRSTPDMVPQVRRMAAAARETLLDLAAEQQKVARGDLAIENGRIKNAKSQETFHYGQVTKGEKLVKTVGENLPTAKPEDWKVCGTSVEKVDGARFVTGEHKYASDVKLPGMGYGKVLRPARLGAKLKNIDKSLAEAIPGVKVVHDGDFVGVVAPDHLTAERALNALKAEWTDSSQVAEEKLFEHLRGNRPRHEIRVQDEGLKQINATYTIAYIAHAPLEPRAAIAEWKNDKLTVWTGTQRPFGVRSELTQAFRVPEERVRVIVPDTGSGYGGKHTGEAAVEAARLAKGAGQPVKLVWTREEEFTHAYFRPAGVIDVSAAAGQDGKISAWEFHNFNSGSSGMRVLYDVPGAKTEFHNSQSPLRQGSYRALAATANHFARESAIDELAQAVGMDPVEFRLKNARESRLRGVIEAAAHNFGWRNKKSVGNTGYGIAAGSEKGSFVATCAEIYIEPETHRLTVKHVLQAFECGAVLNPEHLKNQNEGCIMMALGGALFEAIHFANGAISNPRFSEYRVPRFSDMPKMEVVLVNRKDLASVGAGETPMVGLAPAIANAIFAATGKRLRSLPMLNKGAVA